MDITDKQEKIKKNKGIILYNKEEFDYLDNSTIAKAMYNHSKQKIKKDEKDEDIPYWKQRITCDICGKQYYRSGVTKHRSTQHHKTYMLINEKLRNLMLN